MGSNEDYLDNLLKSMGKTEEAAHKEDGMADTDGNDNAAMSPEDIEAMFAAAEKAANGEAEDGSASIPADIPEEEPALQEETAETDMLQSEDLTEHTVESTQDLLQEEIESLLQASEQAGEEQDVEKAGEQAAAVEATEGTPEEDKEDLLSLLGSLQEEDDDLSEINDLLKKSDNNEPIDEGMFAMLKQASEAREDAEPSAEQNDEQKEKKRKKKNGLFSKLFSALTEEVEEPAADENQTIMEELAKEDLAEAGKKKKLKKGMMPGKKKGKNAQEQEEEQEDGEKKGRKKEKPVKSAKPKKEKKVKAVPVEEEKPSRRISKKSICVVILFAATIFAAILFTGTFLSGILQKQNAKTAFGRQDYLTCYEQMYGMNLSEEEKEMFDHARVVLKMERRIAMYEKYVAEDRELEALDILMRTLAGYDELYASAQSCGAAAEVAALYDRMLQIVQENYGLTEEEARAIALCESNVDYTRYLTALAEGETVSAEGGEGKIVLPKEELQDVLPAEEELTKPDFAGQEE